MTLLFILIVFYLLIFSKKNVQFCSLFDFEKENEIVCAKKNIFNISCANF